MILTGHALLSLRDSGYSLPAALGEPIDNSLEANANNIQVRLIDAADRKRIHQIAVVDDGHGMDWEILHHYLQLGYSTRYMSTKTIGKYGVGAKLAALNFSKRIDVWSRTSAEEPWLHVLFDLQETIQQEKKGEIIGIDPPDTQPVPDHLAPYLPSGSGTLVLWSKVDRLEEGRHASDANALRVEVEKELSRVFRYFLQGGIRISVNDNPILPHDPLFLMTGTWADKVLGEHYKPTVVLDRDEIRIWGLTAELTVTVYPKEVLRERGMGGDKLAEKLRVKDDEGNISFVRLDREIEYTNVPRMFHRGVEDPDRFIGIEVRFEPTLDGYFGVRNVKRGVEPHGELRREIRKRLTRYLPEARKLIEEAWGKAAKKSRIHIGEHGTLVEAVKEVDRTMPKARAKGPADEAERESILEDLVKDLHIEARKEKEEYLARIRELPFVVESVDFPGTNFIDIQHLGDQVIIRLNTRHRFYREMWEPVSQIASASASDVTATSAIRAARRTIEALTLMVIAYGKAESMDQTPHESYSELRGYWGQFLDSLLGKVKGVM